MPSRGESSSPTANNFADKTIVITVKHCDLEKTYHTNDVNVINEIELIIDRSVRPQWKLLKKYIEQRSVQPSDYYIVLDRIFVELTCNLSDQNKSVDVLKN